MRKTLFLAIAIIALLALSACTSSPEGGQPADTATPTKAVAAPSATSTSVPATATATQPAITATATRTSTPTVTVTITSTVTPTSQPTPAAKPFPTSPQEAAALFAPETSASRWEPAVGGGWHMREEPFTTLVDPKGFVAEGYFDTKPGRNPDCFAFTIPVGVQGATFWNEAGTKANAEALQKKMAIPKWDDGASTHACRVLAP